ncbi:hypothetical protein [Shewanella surugensis]|uniref:Uncharacterized protein n=1 Tax=Shewanella surugensis TaxID=212020 RepID=A0ABT0L5D9_9GAMM|nr:hypothetical protein [Shewanella surugensis]MCL1122903.1 hypothetical protein [Shewanella surugensis]
MITGQKFSLVNYPTKYAPALDGRDAIVELTRTYSQCVIEVSTQSLPQAISTHENSTNNTLNQYRISQLTTKENVINFHLKAYAPQALWRSLGGRRPQSGFYKREALMLNWLLNMEVVGPAILLTPLFITRRSGTILKSTTFH